MRQEIRTGGCHCGAVRFEVNVPGGDNNGLGAVIECNCTICQKRGHLLFFVQADQFKLTAQLKSMQDYLFNKKQIHHLFRPTCGIESYATGQTPGGAEMVAVNARCLDDVHAADLSTRAFDGKKL
jgi:hypothetical protein